LSLFLSRKDRDRDGSIDPAEIVSSSSALGLTISFTDASAMVALGDVSQRGSIDFASFFSVFLEKRNAVAGGVGGGRNSGWVPAPAERAGDRSKVLKAVLLRWLDLTRGLSQMGGALAQANPLARNMKRNTVGTGLKVAAGAGGGGGAAGDGGGGDDEGIGEEDDGLDDDGSGSGSGGRRVMRESVGVVVSATVAAMAAFKAQLLPGETVVRTLDRARWRSDGMLGSELGGPNGDSKKELLGTLRVTTFRLIFTKYPPPKHKAAVGKQAEAIAAMRGLKSALASSDNTGSGGGGGGNNSGSSGNSDKAEDTGLRRVAAAARRSSLLVAANPSFTGLNVRKSSDIPESSSSSLSSNFGGGSGGGDGGFDELPPSFSTICVHLGGITKVELQQRLGQQPEVKLLCKDTRGVRVAVEGGRASAEQLVATIRALAFPGSGPRGCFAFKYSAHKTQGVFAATGGGGGGSDAAPSTAAPAPAPATAAATDTAAATEPSSPSPPPGTMPDRWDLFDPVKEYARIGFLDDDVSSGGFAREWRLFEQDFSNKAFEKATASSSSKKKAAAAAAAAARPSATGEELASPVTPTTPANGSASSPSPSSPSSSSSSSSTDGGDSEGGGAASTTTAGGGGTMLLSPTYPRCFVVPRKFSDDQIASAAQFRSKQRLPAATWMDRLTGGVLARASQPMAGLSGKKNLDDIALLEQIRVANGRGGKSQAGGAGAGGDGGDLQNGGSSSGSGRGVLESQEEVPLYFADCRGRVAATGNKLQGKGAENAAHYTSAHLSYCDILNIHTMRESQADLVKLLLPDAQVASATADAAAAFAESAGLALEALGLRNTGGGCGCGGGGGGGSGSGAGGSSSGGNSGGGGGGGSSGGGGGGSVFVVSPIAAAGEPTFFRKVCLIGVCGPKSYLLLLAKRKETPVPFCLDDSLFSLSLTHMNDL
jgi:hypothetical protein